MPPRSPSPHGTTARYAHSKAGLFLFLARTSATPPAQLLLADAVIALPGLRVNVWLAMYDRSSWANKPVQDDGGAASPCGLSESHLDAACPGGRFSAYFSHIRAQCELLLQTQRADRVGFGTPSVHTPRQRFFSVWDPSPAQMLLFWCVGCRDRSFFANLHVAWPVFVSVGSLPRGRCHSSGEWTIACAVGLLSFAPWGRGVACSVGVRSAFWRGGGLLLVAGIFYGNSESKSTSVWSLAFCHALTQPCVQRSRTQLVLAAARAGHLHQPRHVGADLQHLGRCRHELYTHMPGLHVQTYAVSCDAADVFSPDVFS